MKTKHDLPFEVSEWRRGGILNPLTSEYNWKCFRVGTCEGLWCYSNGSYAILSVINNDIGNGHFDDVMEWFEYSCKRDNHSFMIMEVWNKRLKSHLIDKRGFESVKNTDHVIKHFNP